MEHVRVQCLAGYRDSIERMRSIERRAVQDERKRDVALKSFIKRIT